MAVQRPLLPCLLALSALAATALPAARADEPAPEAVRLRSGAVYEATSIEVRGETLVLHLQVGAGGGRASFPFARIHPADLLRLLTARTAADDAAGQARLARLAFEAGRHAEAAERAARAAALDPALGVVPTEIQAAIRATEADAALAEIEADLRARRPLAARERARMLLEVGVPVVPPELQAQRARLLLAIAEGQLQVPPPAMPPLEDPPPPPLDPLPPAPSAALADADKLAERGRARRDEAADPALAPPQREARLLAAADDLLHARRLLQALADAPGIGARLDGLRTLLVATWLDLADLARTAGQPLMALDRVQAALVLDPEHERAWELRRWIEGDLAGAPFVAVEPPVAFSGSWLSSGWYAPGPIWGSDCCPGPYAGGLRGHVRWGRGHAGSHGSSGGAHHNPGRRR